MMWELSAQRYALALMQHTKRVMHDRAMMTQVMYVRVLLVASVSCPLTLDSSE